MKSRPPSRARKRAGTILELAEMAAQLNNLMGQFKIDVKAAGISTAPATQERARSMAAQAGR